LNQLDHKIRMQKLHNSTLSIGQKIKNKLICSYIYESAD